MAKKQEQAQEAVVVESTPVESDAKLAYRKLLELYKVKNPKKYAIKEAELLKKLNQL